MAYKTEIQIAVNGAAQLKVLQDRLERINALTTRINKQASTKFVNLGRLNSETQALKSFNKELERNLALRQRGQSIRPSGGGAGRGGGTGRGPGGGVNRFESAALGVGFPLLFGGGAGQVLGGLAGSFIGTGFGGQILGSALGGAIEQFLGSTAELGNALNDTAPNFDRLIDALGGANNEVGERIRLLEELEGKTAALAAAQEDLADLIGNDGVASLKEYGGDVTTIGSEFSKFFTIMQTNIAELINNSGILKAIIEQVGRATLFAQAEREKERDPELALLFAQRRNVGEAATPPGFAGVMGPDVLKVMQMTEEIDQRIIERQIQLNALKGIGNQEELQTLTLKKQQIEDQKEQEKLERAARQLAREAHRERVNDLRIQQAGIQTQLTQVSNEAKILQLRAQAGASAIQLEKARYSAQLSSLQLEESRLKRQLDGLIMANKGFVQQRKLIDAIAKNQVEQAKIQNQISKLEIDQGIARARIARQQIDLEVQRIRLQIQMNRLKAQEIEDAGRRAAALKQVSAIEKQTMGVIREMVKSGDQQLRNAIEIGKQQRIVADNLLKGKLESIEAERVEARRAANARELANQTGRAANEASRYQSAMRSGGSSRGSSGSSFQLGRKTTQTISTALPIDEDVRKQVLADAPTFGYKSVQEMVGKLNEAQRLKNSRTARMSSVSNSSYSRTASAGSRMYGSSGSTSVNVTTGPVMEFDGSKYVRMDEFERGLAEVGSNMARYSRSYGGRKYGVA